MIESIIDTIMTFLRDKVPDELTVFLISLMKS